MSAQSVLIHNAHASASVSPTFSRQSAALVRRILAAEKRKSYEVSLILTTNPAIRNLNRKYRKKDRATDVLAFGFYPDRPTRTDYGDIYISLDRARQQATAYRVTFNQELRRLIVHGVLHLCGYDHQSTRAEKALTRKTEDWLKPGPRIKKQR